MKKMSTPLREGPGGYCLRSASDNSKRLRSRVVPTSLNSDSRRSKSCHVAKPKREYECTLKEAHATVRPYANMALKFYNERTLANYKLVEPGDMQSVVVVRGCIHHINFTAKKKDVADAPVEMFFAELTTTGIGIRRATTCKCLGPEKDLLEAKTKINGCCFFCMDKNIYHPRCLGYKTGLENNGGIYF